ncbi:hypothetical protein GCM10007301_57180 [Azorhizobium oxalatiphilum]|uniref:Amidohydrolase-related domain-containing protein n=1 Tax=Azorhizobium oxalatiphilum TaxID=980631 RepID=A0A917CIX3_9HYPH|nr:amidohydrolase family protein [Azorhizobium oxalatiphilum]GGF89826.1 hypothetical protein GCM10007301_57180 [Azorhizobium oxalatiphilum]
MPMTTRLPISRRGRTALLLALPLLLAALLPAGPARAQENAQEKLIPIFDAHLHYNWEPKPYYALDEVLALLRRNAITGILATSRPNDGTRALHEAKPDGITVVPFIRPYRVRADIGSWFSDPVLFDLVQAEYKRGYYRGIGEFHLTGEAARGETVRKVVDFAVAHDLYLHAHADDAALEILYAHNPKARIIWAHTGFGLPPARVAELLTRYPNLWAELSYRGGITSGGQLTPDWRALFTRFPDRFLLGSDTWVNERWASYSETMAGYRAWLAQLPPEVAAKIAHRNAEGLFALK